MVCSYGPSPTVGGWTVADENVGDTLLTPLTANRLSKPMPEQTVMLITLRDCEDYYEKLFAKRNWHDRLFFLGEHPRLSGCPS